MLFKRKPKKTLKKYAVGGAYFGGGTQKESVYQPFIFDINPDQRGLINIKPTYVAGASGEGIIPEFDYSHLHKLAGEGHTNDVNFIIGQVESILAELHSMDVFELKGPRAKKLIAKLAEFQSPSITNKIKTRFKMSNTFATRNKEKHGTGEWATKANGDRMVRDTQTGEYISITPGELWKMTLMVDGQKKYEPVTAGELTNLNDIDPDLTFGRSMEYVGDTAGDIPKYIKDRMVNLGHDTFGKDVTRIGPLEQVSLEVLQNYLGSNRASRLQKENAKQIHDTFLGIWGTMDPEHKNTVYSKVAMQMSNGRQVKNPTTGQIEWKPWGKTEEELLEYQNALDGAAQEAVFQYMKGYSIFEDKRIYSSDPKTAFHKIVAGVDDSGKPVTPPIQQIEAIRSGMDVGQNMVIIDATTGLPVTTASATVHGANENTSEALSTLAYLTKTVEDDKGNLVQKKNVPATLKEIREGSGDKQIIIANQDVTNANFNGMDQNFVVAEASKEPVMMVPPEQQDNFANLVGEKGIRNQLLDVQSTLKAQADVLAGQINAETDKTRKEELTRHYNYYINLSNQAEQAASNVENEALSLRRMYGKFTLAGSEDNIRDAGDAFMQQIVGGDKTHGLDIGTGNAFGFRDMPEAADIVEEVKSGRDIYTNPKGFDVFIELASPSYHDPNSPANLYYTRMLEEGSFRRNIEVARTQFQSLRPDDPNYAQKLTSAVNLLAAAMPSDANQSTQTQFRIP